jgi:hypothetical protein
MRTIETAADESRSPLLRPWMGPVLWLAAAYNIVWGVIVIAAPAWTLTLLGVELDAMSADAVNVLLPIWQCVGMIVGVYGVGYAAAARNPLTHWPIVLVGLLGKLFGPVGFVDAVFVREILPASFGWTIITNDLIWWIPFALILHAAWRQNKHSRGAPA